MTTTLHAPSRSRLAGRVIFVVGPPDGAVEDVAAELAACAGGHPPRSTAAAAGGVVRLFMNYIVGDGAGLSAVLDDAEFLALTRALSDDLLDPNEADGLIVDASPEHSHWLDITALLYPDARFVRAVRDIRLGPFTGVRDGWRRGREWRAAHQRLTESDIRFALPGVSVRRPELQIVRVAGNSTTSDRPSWLARQAAQVAAADQLIALGYRVPAAARALHRLVRR
jgi:hypothetical protein